MSTRNAKFMWQDAMARAGLRPVSTGFVGFVLSNRDNGDGRGFSASVAHVARETELSPSTVERAVNQLMAEGWLQRTRKGGRFGEQSVASHYRLTIPTTSGLKGGNGPEAGPDTSHVTGQPVSPEVQPVSHAGVIDQEPLDQQGPSGPVVDQQCRSTPTATVRGPATSTGRGPKRVTAERYTGAEYAEAEPSRDSPPSTQISGRPWEPSTAQARGRQEGDGSETRTPNQGRRFPERI